MALEHATRITELLHQWAKGDEYARDELLPKVYDTLRHMARKRLRAERKNHTFSGTDLVHEAWFAVEQSLKTGNLLENRYHFLNLVGKIMTHELIRHADMRKAQKRGGMVQMVQAEDEDSLLVSDKEQLTQYLEAIERLEETFPDQKVIATATFVVGMQAEEVASFLDLSRATVVRRIRFARAWLQKELGGVS